MKQFFLVRWFHTWRKHRAISRAWDMRAYPPCKFCQRPIVEQSAFCNWCGTAQYQPPLPERNTSGQLQSSTVADAATVPAMPSVAPAVPAPKKRYDVTNELANYYRHGDGISHWRMKAFRRMIFDDEGEEKK